MGVNLPKNTDLAGFSLSQVKRALVGYARTGSATNFLDLKSVAPTRMEAATLYEEFLERQLIDPQAEYLEDCLTQAGLAIASGKIRRSPLRTAQLVLDDLLVRIEQMNNSNPFKVVDRVWLYGSVMRGEETVGDIDLAIETAMNPALSDDASRSRLQELADEAPEHLPYALRLFWHERVGIFGERRHPLLAGAHIGADDLKQMGVPCRLIFDRARGGRVDDEIVPRHPDSLGRSNEMPAPRELPDLSPLPSAPRPMDARWMSAYEDTGSVCSYRLFVERSLAPGIGSYVMTDHTELKWHDWHPRSLKDGGYDGVSKVLLKYHEARSDPKGKDAAAMVLRREVRDLGAELELLVELSSFQRPRKLKPQASFPLIKLCNMVAMIVCGDILRQSIRLAERQSQKMIAVNLVTAELPDEIAEATQWWVKIPLEKLTAELGLGQVVRGSLETAAR